MQASTRKGDKSFLLPFPPCCAFQGFCCTVPHPTPAHPPRKEACFSPLPSGMGWHRPPAGLCQQVLRWMRGGYGRGWGRENAKTEKGGFLHPISGLSAQQHRRREQLYRDFAPEKRRYKTHGSRIHQQGEGFFPIQAEGTFPDAQSFGESTFFIKQTKEYFQETGPKKDSV